MLAFDSLVVVALISSVGALLVAVTAQIGGWLSNRKPSPRRATGVARMLQEHIDWQDAEIGELRTENKHLWTRVRRLENDLEKLRSKP